MTYLRRVDQRFLNVGVYKIEDNEVPIERYVISTPQTRSICNDPSIVGTAYKRGLQQAVELTLSSLPDHNDFSAVPEESVCVFNILRGGLNFRLDDAIANAWGMNNHGSAFVSSQRRPASDAASYEDGCIIIEDTYKKLEIPKHATILCGDVVATGTTLHHNLEVLGNHVEDKELAPQNFIFFTIGCRNTEKIVAEIDERFRKLNPDYNRTVVVYFEGRFGMATNALRDEFLERYSIGPSEPESQVVLPGTDLVRHPGLLAPEFELSQYDSISFPLERCTIYDAGSRAFRVDTHLKDVAEYWKIMRKLGERGVNLYEMLHHRWPLFNSKRINELCEITGSASVRADDINARLNSGFNIDFDSKESLSVLAEKQLEKVGK